MYYKDNKTYITWDDYDLGIKILSNKIKEIQKESNIHLVSIYRGSLVIGQHLSNILDLPLSIGKFQKYDSNDKEFQMIFDNNINEDDLVILLDDLVDSGETLTKAKQYFSKRYIHTYSMTLFGEDLDESHYGVFKKPEGWLVFPWEFN